MTHILGQDKPPLTDALSHHGVKGQKWGVTTERPTSSEIHSARARVGSRTRAINSQIDRTNLSSGSKQEANAKKLSEMMQEHLSNPDRITAARMTKGEKFVTAALTVAAPPAGVAIAGLHAAQVRSIKREVERNS